MEVHRKGVSGDGRRVTGRDDKGEKVAQKDSEIMTQRKYICKALRCNANPS